MGRPETRCRKCRKNADQQIANTASQVSYIQNLVFEKKLPIESSNHSKNRFLSLLSPTPGNWDKYRSGAEISAFLHFFWKKLNLPILLTRNSELHETTTFFDFWPLHKYSRDQEKRRLNEAWADLIKWFFLKNCCQHSNFGHFAQILWNFTRSRTLRFCLKL